MTFRGMGSGLAGAFALMSVVAACGGRASGGFPTPESGRPPLILREIPPDPVPTLDPGCDEDFTVADARPVSATTIGHYYIENGGLVYLALVRGTPAWYGNLSDWQVPPPPPGRHLRNAEISGFRYALNLDIGERTLSVLDKEVDLRKTNVVFLDRVGNTLSVVGGELMNLCWTSQPDAVGQVLSRSPAATRFVKGTPASQSPAPARRTRR
ncbi:MAG TPA: hypothetical protein VNO75_07505 [Gemmatimonadaceae bacterium]|nr:hypothetical protein [Gemmatimonadaceae bacterium]